MCKVLLLRRTAKDIRGATAVEFAMVAPVMVAILLGAIELCMMFYTYATAGYAARDVARRVGNNTLAIASATTTATAELPNWVRSSTTVSATTQATSGPTAGTLVVVTVSFPMRAASPTGFLVD